MVLGLLGKRRGDMGKLSDIPTLLLDLCYHHLFLEAKKENVIRTYFVLSPV